MRVRGSILICVHHLARGYSGGRYHAWLIGEALAAAAWKVTLWTDNLPVFAQDFAEYPQHDEIEVVIDRNFESIPEEKFDWVLAVPHLTRDLAFTNQILRATRSSQARLALLNFESPNFLRASGIESRHAHFWPTWEKFSRWCDLIVSSTELSNRYARDFYQRAPRECSFRACPPSINSLVADRVEVGARKEQIFVTTRFASTDAGHKGGDLLLEVIGPEMAGFDLVVLVGKGGVPEKIKDALARKSEEHRVRLRIAEELNDEEKFAMIKSSRLTLFFSQFEGFGYPPVESLYCETPCIAFDLPVLREISGEGLRYVPLGNVETFRNAIREVLESPVRESGFLKEHVEGVASFTGFAERFSALLESTTACESRSLPSGLRGWLGRRG